MIYVIPRRRDVKYENLRYSSVLLLEAKLVRLFRSDQVSFATLVKVALRLNPGGDCLAPSLMLM